MIVHDFNIEDFAFPPGKTNPPLVVDSDAVLALAITLEGFEPISRRHLQIIEATRLVKVQELSARNPLDSAKPRNDLIPKQRLGVWITEGANHQLACYYVMRNMSTGIEC